MYNLNYECNTIGAYPGGVGGAKKGKGEKEGKRKKKKEERKK